MRRQISFRKCSYTLGLFALALFVASCSEEPASGPFSPMSSVEKKTPIHNTIRPVPRKSDAPAPVRHSLAKGAYTDLQLLALINQQPALSTGDLKAILLSESPLSSEVLLAVLKRNPKMSTGDLKAILLASTPIASEVQEAAQNTNLMSSGDLQTVMEAQAGFGSQFLGKTVSKWTTKKDGGTIWHGGHKIIFPKDALAQDATASIAISSSDYVQVDFGPDGWFNKEVTVIISYKNVDLNGVNESSLTLAWFDETTGQWIEVGGTVDTKKKWITAKVWHFTQYTLSTK
ncbi:hypothetical protein HUU05_22850 [candidate division KSB1 bacterium]|nr:hypothetical protein [candidate division KSB1 bacterium]